MASVLPESILNDGEEAQQQTVPTLPDKSLARYVTTYEKFMQWRKSQNTISFDEEVLLAYFCDSAKSMKPSTLWCIYSMLKATISSNHNVNIGQYVRLKSFLKKNTAGFESTIPKVLTVEEIKKFLVKAPDAKYLGVKAVAVFGVCGLYRAGEIASIRVDQVRDCGTEIVVKMPCSKTDAFRVYLINGSLADIVRKYIELRPPQMMTNRFFVQYRAQKCTMQVMGKHSIAKLPRLIAEFLGLPDPSGYNGKS